MHLCLLAVHYICMYVLTYSHTYIHNHRVSLTREVLPVTAAKQRGEGGGGGVGGGGGGGEEEGREHRIASSKQNLPCSVFLRT